MPKKSRMFHLDRDRPIKTWNPCHGCKYGCYGGNCWAARTARRLQAAGVESYRQGFELVFAAKELEKRFRPDTVVFVSSMGDLFGEWVPGGLIFNIIGAMERSPEATFFLETKNPGRYWYFRDFIPKNSILSTTIETNKYYDKISHATAPINRYYAMAILHWPRKHVSIEPIMKFDLGVLVDWVREINPVLVSVGYDNYNCGLPEPTLNETLALIAELEKFTKVERKTLREGRTNDW